jgi:hypothetical protein
MDIRLPGLIPALVLGLAAGLVFGSVAPSHADHELPKPPPLWSPLDDVERLALIEVPEGWPRCRPVLLDGQRPEV